MRILRCVCFLALFAITRSSVAQTLDESDQQKRNESYQNPGVQKLSPKSLVPQEFNGQTAQIPILDGPIDPAGYIVGPGDIYVVSIWTSMPLNFQLAVSPEGTLIIPSVGEVPVAGLSLEKAKKRVIEEAKKRYIASNVTCTLVTPRLVLVNVNGTVHNEGSMFLQSTERVEGAVALADRRGGGLSTFGEVQMRPKHVVDNINNVIEQDTLGSRRKILVYHRDGSFSRVDLEKYFVERSHDLNPYLRDGDVITVPRRELERNFIGVYGGVNKQGLVEFVEGDSLLLMVKIARGLTPMADSDHVCVQRSDEKGRIVETIAANLSAIVSGQSKDVALQRGDRIVVQEFASLKRDYKVLVEGEVNHPGFYPIAKDSTTIGEIIHEAGGLTPSASAETSILFRSTGDDSNLPAERLEVDNGLHLQEDTINFRAENELRLRREEVVVDFAGIFSGRQGSNDVFLRDGDRLVIGSLKQTVYVFGQVAYPGHIPYSKDHSYSYYTDKAGGLTDKAVRGDIRIVKGSTKQWLAPGETTIEPGDYIWVPAEPYRSFSYYLQAYSQIFAIVGTVATLVILVAQLKK
jgi:protein involved in polysaccharide export with SLBB domain